MKSILPLAWSGVLRPTACHLRWLLPSLLASFAASAISAGPPNVVPPGPAFELPSLPTAPDVPQIFEHSQEAGPDETFFLVGKGLTRDLFIWGTSADGPTGGPVQAKVQMAGDNYLMATISEKAYDGPFVVSVKNKAGYSAPIVLNAPQPWWCRVDEYDPTCNVRIFGRNLGRRPDLEAAFVYLVSPDGAGKWSRVHLDNKYSIGFKLPADTEPGEYRAWLHAGRGGIWGWGGPVTFTVRKRASHQKVINFEPKSADDLQKALDMLGRQGGGILQLPRGTFPFVGTLRIPADVTLRGIGQLETRLQLETSPLSDFPQLRASAWGQGVSSIHTPGDTIKLSAKDGRLPGGDRAAVWVSGDAATIEELAVFGTPQVNQGIAVRSPDGTSWLNGCRIQGVTVADCEGKQAENCGIYVRNLQNGVIHSNTLHGRTPIFLSGVRRTRIGSNSLISTTRFGGNSEAAILGRTEPIEECVIEHNSVRSPFGAEAGGPTARRLIWLSTGHGSIVHNYLAHNGFFVKDDSANGSQFGGVAGTDQNVGEMILFEGNHRTMYFGPLAGADQRSVTLPETLKPTRDDRLGSVTRQQLAHDAHGRETPFWPPDADDGSLEPPISEYFVTVFAGPGWGQTRRVLKRDGMQLMLDRPWRVAPEKGSIVAIGVMFHQNLVIGNSVADGMTGIQLWISCVENIVSGNTIARQRKPGLFFYANGTTLASSMPRTWNRGISPLFWNVAESNHAEECSDGALITSGDGPNLPIEFPRALGNVLRHNSFVRSRGNGIVLTSRKGTNKTPDTAASVFGTIAEFNLVRDARTAYRAGYGVDAVVWRRNHAYFWYPVSNSNTPPVAFETADPKTTATLELNTVEGPSGVPSPDIILEKKPE